jgi:hypothetical protein
MAIDVRIVKRRHFGHTGVFPFTSKNAAMGPIKNLGLGKYIFLFA